MYDVQSFDPELGRTLLEFLAVVCRRKYIESTSGKNSGTGSDLLYRGSRIEDLCLDFSVPGYSDYFSASGDNSEVVTTLPFYTCRLSLENNLLCSHLTAFLNFIGQYYQLGRVCCADSGCNYW